MHGRFKRCAAGRPAGQRAARSAYLAVGVCQTLWHEALKPHAALIGAHKWRHVRASACACRSWQRLRQQWRRPREPQWGQRLNAP
eukprot:320801-Chlamydomonas_euryale.AAC.1